MLKEIEYTFDNHVYRIRQMNLPESQEVLVRLLKLLGGTVGEAESLSEEALSAAILGLPKNIDNKDIEFLKSKLFGANCALRSDEGLWTPMGPEIVNNHFAGRIGAMFHMLGKCLLVNYSSFLADLGVGQLRDEVNSPE